MTDFHTHILPAMDDGSASIRESLELLRMEHAFGVDTVMLTPHFYADQNSVKQFLTKRKWSLGKLRDHLGDDAPTLLPGAEVQYFEGIGSMDDLPSLCIEGTGLLLLEMPFSHWSDRMIRTVVDLNTYGGVRVVLAHIERYMGNQRKELWGELRQEGILTQVNASFFGGWLKRRKALSMMEQDLVQFIGSDCHNMSHRKPNWNLVPEEAKRIADRNAKRLLPDP